MPISPSNYPAYSAECGDPTRTRILGPGTRPAIVLIDVCGAYMSPSSPLSLPQESISSTTLAIRKLLTTARSTIRNVENDAIPVFYIQTVFTHPTLRDAGLLAKKQPHAHLFSATHPENYISLPTSEVYAELQARPLDMLHHKKFPSAFFGSNLASQLTALGVDTVFIGGYLTSVAVRSTAIDAMQAGFRSIVVAEACADRGTETHWANLMDHDAKYGDVMGVDDVVGVVQRGWS